MTTAARPTLTAADGVRLVRPLDLHSHAALRRLARAFDARIRRGALLLAGQPHPALLAMAPDGAIIAAVLLGEDGAASLTSTAPSTTPSTPIERAPCAHNSQEA